MHDRLREQWRQRLQRQPLLSAAVLDAQTTRSTPQDGSVGFDAGKKDKGRKWHLLVDTLGLLPAVAVTSASSQDRDAAPRLLAMGCAKAPALKTLFVDNAYSDHCARPIQRPASRTVRGGRSQFRHPQFHALRTPANAIRARSNSTLLCRPAQTMAASSERILGPTDPGGCLPTTIAPSSGSTLGSGSQRLVSSLPGLRFRVELFVPSTSARPF